MLFLCHPILIYVIRDGHARSPLHPQRGGKKYGERYHIVTYEDRIELIPVADDPLAAVRTAAGELREASVEEIREGIEDEAKAEARSEGGR